MPLPLALAIAAGIAGVTGVGSGIHGAKKMKDANDTLKAAEARHKRNVAKFDKSSDNTNKKMDELGKLELEILSSFETFADTIEKIQNRPQFKEYKTEGVKLPKYDKEELKKVSIGAGVLLGGLGGAAVGTAGGFAAAGATTSAVMALGTASTGTAIASLSGVAATNATLAALGGGAISAGGGGIALGTTMLSATTLGVGLLVGGVIFNVVGGSMSNKADEAWSQMKKAEGTIETICTYLNKLRTTANKYIDSLKKVNEKYQESFQTISNIVNVQHKVDWNEFTEEEKIDLQNTVLLVGLLYKMCKVKLVNKAKNDNEINTVNTKVVNETLKESEGVMSNLIVETVGNSEKSITDSKNETHREKPVSTKCYDGTDICKECADVVRGEAYIELDDYLVCKDKEKLMKVSKEDGSMNKLDISIKGYFDWTENVCGWGQKLCYIDANDKGTSWIYKLNVDTGECEKIEFCGNVAERNHHGNIRMNEKYIIYKSMFDGKTRVFCYDFKTRKTAMMNWIHPKYDYQLEVKNYYLLNDDIYFTTTGEVYRYQIKDTKLTCITAELDFQGRFFLANDRHTETQYYNGILYTVDTTDLLNNRCLYFIDLKKPNTLQKAILPGSKENEYHASYGKVYYVTVDGQSTLGYFDVASKKKTAVMDYCPVVGSYREGRKTVYVQPHGQIVGKWYYGIGGIVCLEE